MNKGRLEAFSTYLYPHLFYRSTMRFIGSFGRASDGCMRLSFLSDICSRVGLSCPCAPAPDLLPPASCLPYSSGQSGARASSEARASHERRAHSSGRISTALVRSHMKIASIASATLGLNNSTLIS